MARAKKWSGGYIDRDSGYFYVRRKVSGTLIHFSTRCKTLDGALSVLREWETDPANFIPGRVASTTVADDFDACVKDYLDYSFNVRGNTQDHVSKQAARFDALKTFMAPKGITNLRQITPRVVDEYVAWRRQGGLHGNPVGPHALALDVAAIKGLMTWASRAPEAGGFLEVNPLGKYPIPKRPKDSGKIKTFSLEWWSKVRPSLPELYQLCGDVLLGSAMRWSSLSRLQPDDVDLEQNVIRLRGNAIKGKDGVTVYVSEAVAKAALEVAKRGIYAGSGIFDKALVKACEEAEVPYFSAHCFRHTAASMAIEDGVLGKDLQHRLAHSSFGTTERYVHRLGQATGSYRGRI